MKIVALEEHFVMPAVCEAWDRLSPERAEPSLAWSSTGPTEERLADLADRRVADMDDSGVDVQVLSLTTPGVQTLDPDVAVPLARAVNDRLAAVVAGRPDRFDGFATLPTPAPGAAARELRRAADELGLRGAMLFGRTGGRNLDDPAFEPIWGVAAERHIPIYLHPQSPPPVVRAAYYTGFGAEVDALLASGGLGWHVETGVQLLRLILSGVFDRHPDLQVVVGHWGETVLFFLDRVQILDRARPRIDRPVRDYFLRNVSYTPSGIFSETYLQQAVRIVGAERVLFATDYPFQLAPGGGARAFLTRAPLADPDRELIAHGNWERLTGQPARPGPRETHS